MIIINQNCQHLLDPNFYIMTDNISQRKIDFIDYYIKDWLDVSLSDPHHVINISKFLISALKFNDIEKEKLIEITSKTLQEVLKTKNYKPEKIPWFALDKGLNWPTRYVDFFVENDQIIPKVYIKNPIWLW